MTDINRVVIALGIAVFFVVGISLSVIFNDPYPVQDIGPKPTVTYLDKAPAFENLPADLSAPQFIESLPLPEEPAVKL